jgi:hypothetical protein
MLTWIFWEVHKFSVISSENKTCHQTLFPQKVCDGRLLQVTKVRDQTFF